MFKLLAVITLCYTLILYGVPKELLFLVFLVIIAIMAIKVVIQIITGLLKIAIAVIIFMFIFLIFK